MSVRLLRDSLRSVVPNWLANRPGFQNGFTTLYAVAQLLDVMLENTVQGVRFWMPGYSTIGNGYDPTSALPYHGRARGILQGEAESDASYGSRLVRWFDTWRDAASSEVLGGEIQAWLGNTPMVRIVDRRGFWVTVNTDGTITTGFGTWTWDWDSKSNPERSGWWSDLWIIVYPCEWSKTPNLGTRKADPHDTAFGHYVDPNAIDAILSLVHTWKGAHSWVVAIVWSYDSALFDPAVPHPTGNPDGWWGKWGKDDGSGNRISARNNSCRYWTPTTGG